MRTRKLPALLTAALLLLAVAVPAMAAESFTVSAIADTDANTGSGWANSFRVISAAWTANSGGTMANQTIPAHKGKLLMVVTNPGATAPTDNYDIQLWDAHGADVLGGAGMNRDTATSEQAVPTHNNATTYAPRPIYGPMTFSLSGNSVDSALGEVFLYFAE